MRQKSVLISGAGIAGPALAYWLQNWGFEPVLIERAAQFREGGYMIDFWGVGFDVVERMNLIPHLRDVGYLIDRVKFVDERGRTRSGFNAEMLRRTLGNRFFSLPRGDLARAIFDTVADKIETIFGDCVTAIHENPDGVDVQFEHGHTRRFDLVAGCDGLHSAVRQIAWGQEKEFEKYLGYYCASFITANYPHREERAYTSYAEPGRQISRYALRGGRTAFFLMFARGQPPLSRSPDQAYAKATLREMFEHDRWTEVPEILQRLETCDDVYFDSVSQIRMPEWSKGRIVLVGDAAYCPSLLSGRRRRFRVGWGLSSGGRIATRKRRSRSGVPRIRAAFLGLHRAKTGVSPGVRKQFHAQNSAGAVRARLSLAVHRVFPDQRLAHAPLCDRSIRIAGLFPLRGRAFEDHGRHRVLLGMAESNESRRDTTLCREFLRRSRKDEERLAAWSFTDVDVAPADCFADSSAECFRDSFLRCEARSQMARWEFH
jgi:2-polyprenyl-6-methoxyphenol hydroxylase-like FAD-dependent oxidoreductase